jgi:hypothetical protein
MNWSAIIGFLIVGLTAGLILFLAIFVRRKRPSWRKIPVIEELYRQVGLSVEDGRRQHFSIGRASLLSPESMASLVAVEAFRKVARDTSRGDYPPVATAGDGALTILSQSVLQQTPQANRAFLLGRTGGLTPFSYVAGVLQDIHDPKVSSNVLVGHYGLEIGLLTDAAERARTFVMAGSDDIAAQAIAYASTPEPLIGEELYVVSAYLDDNPLHLASVRVQDLWRWGIVIVLLLGAILNLAGVL